MRRLSRVVESCGQGGQCPEDFPIMMAYVYQAQDQKERVAAWRDMCDQLPWPDFERRFIFSVMYPQIDERVTTEMHHCLKAPFCVHPGTKRFSVPIPDIDAWGPHDAPRISDVVPLETDTAGANPYQRARPDTAILSPYVTHMMAVINRAYPLRAVYVNDQTVKSGDDGDAGDEGQKNGA